MVNTIFLVSAVLWVWGGLGRGTGELQRQTLDGLQTLLASFYWLYWGGGSGAVAFHTQTVGTSHTPSDLG